MKRLADDQVVVMAHPDTPNLAGFKHVTALYGASLVLSEYVPRRRLFLMRPGGLAAPAAAGVSGDPLVEGCPDCGKDTVVVGQDDVPYCTDRLCGWRA